MDKPLQGIRVLELSTYVAAPLCGRLMADMGADVIKVERATGDDWRKTGAGWLPRFSEDENPIFDLYNSGKRCIVLNLKDSDGMRVFRQLLDKADVFLTNTRPQALKRLGLSYEDLKEQYPGLIYAILVGYGEKGPDAELPAFDVTAFWARSGFLRDQAILHEHYTPVDAPSSAGDTVTGLNLLAEINAALLRRERTGKGDCVRSGLFHNGLFTFGTMEIAAQRPWGATYPRKKGVQSMFHCADDEWIMIGMGFAMNHADRVYELLGHPEFSQDERFCTREARGRHSRELHDIMIETFETKPAEYWLKEARRLDLPVIRLQHYADATQDEQAWANGYLEHVTFRNGEQAIMPVSPINMESVGELHSHSAPYTGEHTAEVLSELGYTKEQIEAMVKTGAVSTR